MDDTYISKELAILTQQDLFSQHFQNIYRTFPPELSHEKLLHLYLYTRLILEIQDPLSDNNGLTVFQKCLLSLRFVKFILL